jgi:tyrosine-protein phosphatase SIW14
MRCEKFLLLVLVCSPVWAAAEAQTAISGVPNFHQVNERIFRGGQPTDEGWESLRELGVKVVISLRRGHKEGEYSADAEAKAVRAAGMHFVNVPMKGIVAPADSDIAAVMAILNGAEPVFVHCKKGKDRTGAVIACYRISHDHWTNAKAMEEAVALGLHRREVGMKRYISQFNAAAISPGAGSEIHRSSVFDITSRKYPSTFSSSSGVPSCSIRPFCSTNTRSTSVNIDFRCAMTRVVRFSDSTDSALFTDASVRKSRLAVASSRMRMVG